MSFKIKLQRFQGPFDLLLSFVKENKLEISDISLAIVADQYLDFIKSNKNITSGEMADFLVVATKLLLLKSRLLLPKLEFEEEEGDLTGQLKIYKEYLYAAGQIEKIISDKKYFFYRQRSIIPVDTIFSPPVNLKLNDLRKNFTEIIKDLKKFVFLPKKVLKKTVCLKQKINQINILLKQRQKVRFNDLIKQEYSKSEVVISFLALLEMLKQNQIKVKQNSTIDDIMISK
jgi:segregation and condensation protein A